MYCRAGCALCTVVTADLDSYKAPFFWYVKVPYGLTLASDFEYPGTSMQQLHYFIHEEAKLSSKR